MSVLRNRRVRKDQFDKKSRRLGKRGSGTSANWGERNFKVISSNGGGGEKTVGGARTNSEGRRSVEKLKGKNQKSRNLKVERLDL